MVAGAICGVLFGGIYAVIGVVAGAVAGLIFDLVSVRKNRGATRDVYWPEGVKRLLKTVSGPIGASELPRAAVAL